MLKVLILEDDFAYRETLQETCALLGVLPHAVATIDAAQQMVQTHADFALALIDLRLAGEDGMDFVRWLRLHHPKIPAVVLTAFATSENTIEAMKLGAFDHLTKPITRPVLEELFARVQQHAVPAVAVVVEESGLIGQSALMREVQKRIGMAAASDVTVLITGETGTGKEVVATLIHRHSKRASKPFVGINCAAIPSELLESELFGHVKGAFSGAHSDRLGRFREADGGTILLDEIGDMPLTLQAKLLRVLQEREVSPVGGNRAYRLDVRIIAATHRDMLQEVAAGRFRQDLYYRLAVFPIGLPPLRARKEDIPLLANHVLRRFTPSPVLHEAALRRLLAYDWSGNVRELFNVLTRAALETRNGVITPELLTFPSVVSSGTVCEETPPWDASLHEAIAWLERHMIQRALAKHQGNISAAARQLGISRQQLYRRLEKCPPAQQQGVVSPDNSSAEDFLDN